MQEIRTFASEFGELNVLEINGKTYFPGTQCARMLGYKQPAKAVREACDLEGCLNQTVLTPGGPQRIKFISEGNLYRLIIKSKLSTVKKFERWVFDEVLPSIRRSGDNDRKLCG